MADPPPAAPPPGASGLCGAHGGDGQEGLRLARATRPDLILSNYDMPTMDGPTLLRQLRAHPETANIPVVLITGALEFDQVMGFDAVIHKPLDSPDLLDQIRRWLQ